MEEVKWIKIYTNMVSHKKIRRIRTLPEGNNIVLIWFFLLMQAGESNKNGGLFLTESMPFTIEDLAIEFDFEVSIIKLALITLEKFSMVEVFDDVIFIKNWDKYQNIDGLEKIREQTRARVAEYRKKQKLLTVGNVTETLQVTEGNATELDIDLELDKEKENTLGKQPKNNPTFFESIWQTYPCKKGKGKVKKTQISELEKIGFDELSRCIQRYIEAKPKWQEYQNGSTFFNSGYIDYLDKNYATQVTPTPTVPYKPKIKIIGMMGEP